MKARAVESLITVWAWASGIGLLAAVGGLLGFLLYKGIGTLTPVLIFGTTDPWKALLLQRQVFDGLFPAIVGTLVLVLLAVSLAVPVGIAAGIYMAEYASGSLKRIFGLFCDVLAGIPSIVVGLFGFSAAIYLHTRFSEQIYPCLLISALSLAFLVLPYLIRTTQVALEELPSAVRLAAPALGATRLQNIHYVLLPRSLPGIASGVILAIGRCAEDTAVIMLTGVVATAGAPKSLMAPYEALPFYIYYVSSQYANSAELMKGYGAAIILLAVCGLLFLLAMLIRRRLTEIFLYRP